MTDHSAARVEADAILRDLDTILAEVEQAFCGGLVVGDVASAFGRRVEQINIRLSSLIGRLRDSRKTPVAAL